MRLGGFSIFFFVVLAACQPRYATVNAPAAPLLPPSEGLGIDDVFQIRVFEEPEFSAEFRVAGDGTIDYPHVGRLMVVGLRENEVQAEITRRLKEGEILKNPQVSVFVKDWNSRKINVLGQVSKPGPVTYFPNMTIVDAIAAAGGFTPIAAKNNVNLSRAESGRVKTTTHPVQDISEGRAANVMMQPRDIVVVDERMF